MKKLFSVILCMILCFHCFPAEVKAAEAEMERTDEGITYKSSVVKETLEEVEAYTIEESGERLSVQIPVTSETAELVPGDNIILPANEENPVGAALTVIGVEEEAGEMKLVCEEGEALSDFVQSIDISGYGEFLPEQALGADASVLARGIGVDFSNQFSKVGRIDYEFNNTALMGDAIINGKVSVEISAIEYRLKMDVGLRNTVVEDFYFAVNHTVDVAADVSFQTNEGRSGGEIELGSVPFVLGRTGVNGKITFWLTYDAKGTINITYTLSNLTGITYENGGYRTFAENNHSFAVLAGFDFTAGPKMQFALNFGRNIKLLDVTFQAGITGQADANANMDENNLANAEYQMDAFVYLTMIPGDKGLINQSLGFKEKEIWNRQTSPYYVSFGAESRLQRPLV